MALVALGIARRTLELAPGACLRAVAPAIAATALALVATATIAAVGLDAGLPPAAVLGVRTAAGAIVAGATLAVAWRIGHGDGPRADRAIEASYVSSTQVKS
jgi:hypothetical protein